MGIFFLLVSSCALPKASFDLIFCSPKILPTPVFLFGAFSFLVVAMSLVPVSREVIHFL